MNRSRANFKPKTKLLEARELEGFEMRKTMQKNFNTYVNKTSHSVKLLEKISVANRAESGEYRYVDEEKEA